MKIKTSELTGPALDWAVAKCEPAGLEFRTGFSGEPLLVDEHDFGNRFIPSTDWARGGPIIEREAIDTYKHGLPLMGWVARIGKLHAYGTTPLIAAMRCYVASKLGDEVEVPDELT